MFFPSDQWVAGHSQLDFVSSWMTPEARSGPRAGMESRVDSMG